MTDNAAPETLHASCVAIDDAAVLIVGRSGSGKSDLALRLIDRGAMLVSDDYTIVRREGAALRASAPATIAGMIEVRGIGIVPDAHIDDVAIALIVDLDAAVERMPERLARRSICGIPVPVLPLAGFEASTPIKLELALRRLGAQDGA
ncbi:MAG: HPr kinase/phosphorylase [Sphingomonas bacterium]|nr:HPr kinase/phosphorylase [Sphingomonas bacterium]